VKFGQTVIFKSSFKKSPHKFEPLTLTVKINLWYFVVGETSRMKMIYNQHDLHEA